MQQPLPLIRQRIKWPEVTQYECTSCHSPLTASTYAGFRRRPGQPRLAALSLAQPAGLAAAEAPHSGGYLWPALDKLDTMSGELGDAHAIAAAALEVAKRARPFEKEMRLARFDKAMRSRLLQGLRSVQGSRVVDYETALRTLQTFDCLYSDLEPKPANDPQIRAAYAALRLELEGPRNRNEREELLRQLLEKKAADPRAFSLDEFRQAFHGDPRTLPPNLTLHTLRDRISNDQFNEVLVELVLRLEDAKDRELQARLARMGQYNPTQVRQRLRELVDLLGKDP